MKFTFSFAVIILGLLSANTAFSTEENPVFGEYESQLSISAGQSFRSGFEKEDLYYGDITYSQPTTFFRLPARRNISLGGYRGDECDNVNCVDINGTPERDFSQNDLTIFGISEDVVLFSVGDFYTTLGLGIYIKSESTNRVSSKFTFGERFGLGYRINRVNFEVYARHFSNGTLTDENSGQNFYGLTLAFNF